MDSFEKRTGRAPQERTVQRFSLVDPSKSETNRTRRETDEAGKKRVREFWPSLVEIEDGDVRLALTEVIRKGGIKSDDLKRLLELSERVPAKTKAFIKLLKKANADQKLKTIEEALAVDAQERTKYETRKFTNQALSASKEGRVSFSEYGATARRLYNLLWDAFSTTDTSPEKGMRIFKDAKLIISQVEEIAKHSQGLVSKEAAKDVFFGDELKNRQSASETGRRNPPPPLPPRPQTRKQ
ncbi:MAG: hypothetical protein AB7J40_04305 [Candidatus Altimarinota bacterium]